MNNKYKIMKHLVVIISFFLLPYTLLGQNKCEYESCEGVLSQMQFFFEKTLQYNYGEHIDTTLYKMFFEAFYKHNGDYVLHVDTARISKLNQILSEDSIFSCFYIQRYFVSSSDSIQILKDKLNNQGKIDFSISNNINREGKAKKKSKFNTSFNPDGYIYKSILKRNTTSEVLSYALEKQHLLGTSQNMFELIDWINHSSRELSNSELKEYITLTFWPYLSDCADISFPDAKQPNR